LGKVPSVFLGKDTLRRYKIELHCLCRCTTSALRVFLTLYTVSCIVQICRQVIEREIIHLALTQTPSSLKLASNLLIFLAYVLLMGTLNRTAGAINECSKSIRPIMLMQSA